jgi:2,3-bisphosphoglycerate-independent phosphoglycerate mutase
MNSRNKIIFIVMDGWGYSENPEGNAVMAAKTLNIDKLWEKYPHCYLKTDGESVGLPEGQMGTSEVNHMTIGAGRVIFQDLVRINKAIKDDELAQNEAILQAIEHVKKHDSVLHIKGLLSDGGVHSHQEHFYGLLSLAHRMGITKVLVHVFTDGRDTAPNNGKKYIAELEDFMQKLGIGRIASISGRYYAMDRDNNWDRIDLAYNALIKGEGRRYSSALEAIEDAYKQGETDEFIIPSVIVPETRNSQETASIEKSEEEIIEAMEQATPGEVGTVGSNDAVIFVNFRADRGIQISKRFTESGLENLNYTTMTHYRDDMDVHVAFPPQSVENDLGSVLSRAGLKQLRISETEKYNHVTFFFNCKQDHPYEGEDRIMLDSNSDVRTHDEKPEMRAFDITKQIVGDINGEIHDVIIVNFPNPDMVGHTANMPAVIKAVETVDECVGTICEEALKKDYTVLITADHGNAEELIDFETGGPKTSHTLNPVPFIIVSNKDYKMKRDKSTLVDIAPTILQMLELPKPEEMTGESLV